VADFVRHPMTQKLVAPDSFRFGQTLNIGIKNASVKATFV
jgi:hypothetical protein